jgi:hypothetical protein
MAVTILAWSLHLRGRFGGSLTLRAHSSSWMAVHLQSDQYSPGIQPRTFRHLATLLGQHILTKKRKSGLLTLKVLLAISTTLVSFLHTSLSSFFFIRYFLHLHFKCYPKSSLYHPPALLPFLLTPISWPWRSPVLRHIKFARPMGLSAQWWLTRPSSDTHAARDKSSGVLVSSYCCSTYRVADPFSSLGTFSTSSIGGPVFHPIADCEHPLLCLLGPSIASQETAISGSFQQNLASVCHGVSVWRLIMGWIPRWTI